MGKKRPGPGYRPPWVVTAATLNGDKYECPGCRKTTLIETVLHTIAIGMQAEVGSLWLFLGNEQLDPESTLHDAKVGRDTCLTIMRKPYEDSTSDDDPPGLVDTSSEEPPRRLREVREESDSDDSEYSDEPDFLRAVHAAIHARKAAEAYGPDSA